MRRFALLCVLLAVPRVAVAEPPPPKPPPHPMPPVQAKPPPKPEAYAKSHPKKQGKDRSKPAPDDVARRNIAGGPTAEEAAETAETPELKALREIEREMFAPAAPKPGTPFPNDLPFPLPIDPERPAVHATGLPPAQDGRDLLPGAPASEPELAWIRWLQMPDLPVRWDARVVRYLQFFRDDPRGRSFVANAWRKSGKYADVIQGALRSEHVPAGLVWVAMVESGFEPTAKSHAGAAGLFQLMPDGARVYGLRVDRWVDERLDPVLASKAGARFLSDLNRRFGSWELALAAYNMGYGAVLAAIRKYNTNDYWELARHEAGLPWETTLYVPKIIALAVAAENPSVFGLDGVTRDPQVTFTSIKVAGGTSLESIARASKIDEKTLETLNPQLRARRTPPDAELEVKLPKGAELSPAKLAEIAAREPKLGTYVVRFGQTPEAIAEDVGITRSRLFELNGMTSGDLPRAGETLLVPVGTRRAKVSAEKPVVVAPASPSAIPGKTRVFYRVLPGDTLRAIAEAFGVTADDLRSWNAIDPGARLQEAMTLQVFVDPAFDLSRVVALREDEATVLAVGSDSFFAWAEAQKGRRRIAVTCGANDTWNSVASKYGCSVATLERINRRPRTEPLRPNDTLIVYTGKPGSEPEPTTARDPLPLPELGALPSSVPPSATTSSAPNVPSATTPPNDHL